MAKLDKLAPDSVEVKHFPDVQLAIAAIRDHRRIKRIQIEDYRLEGVGANSYLSFMTFLQQQLFHSVRRFILVHPEPEPVNARLWKASGNGVCQLVSSLTWYR
jgi:hypothetical protein